MAFAVAYTRTKRLKMITDQGQEEYEKRDPLDSSYLQFLDPNADNEKETETKVCCPCIAEHTCFAMHNAFLSWHIRLHELHGPWCYGAQHTPSASSFIADHRALVQKSV